MRWVKKQWSSLQNQTPVQCIQLGPQLSYILAGMRCSGIWMEKLESQQYQRKSYVWCQRNLTFCFWTVVIYKINFDCNFLFQLCMGLHLNVSKLAASFKELECHWPLTKQQCRNIGEKSGIYHSSPGHKRCGLESLWRASSQSQTRAQRGPGETGTLERVLLMMVYGLLEAWSMVSKEDNILSSSGSGSGSGSKSKSKSKVKSQN